MLKGKKDFPHRGNTMVVSTISLEEKRNNFLERKGLSCIGEKFFRRKKTELPE
jgi:hypothetical protein